MAICNYQADCSFPGCCDSFHLFISSRYVSFCNAVRTTLHKCVIMTRLVHHHFFLSVAVSGISTDLNASYFLVACIVLGLPQRKSTKNPPNFLVLQQFIIIPHNCILAFLITG